MKLISNKYFYGNTGNPKHTDYIVKYLPSDIKLKESYVGNFGDSTDEDLVDKAQRHSKNASIAVQNNPFMPLLDTIMRNANDIIWKLDYKCEWEDEQINYIVYDEPGAHFLWHSDSYDFVSKDYKDRKLSVSYCLSHASDYEGGEFCIEDKEFHMDYGDFIVFPSQDTEHCIKPLISGVRHVLVGFSC